MATDDGLERKKMSTDGQGTSQLIIDRNLLRIKYLVYNIDVVSDVYETTVYAQLH